ncbi:hypothetical protein HMPREF2526_01115 [Corynebacterium sp. HMSC070E08]|uniref:DUF1850 domain-containing protein n=1 Tax=Corynebacterium sp. HMSC070E08 TaxID=1715006 RepID=UPI0008A478C0|nr:DUF1850 domain-containing protein [Corynebacterium sp. HMSC070E08]OFN79734.1 hypothetical protein HMPREF2526_01115 [Corynebacterium sp. HMSC070E08]
MVKRSRFALVAVLGVIVLALTVVGPFAFSRAVDKSQEPRLIVADSRGSDIYFETPASRIEHIELEWIHSVEKEPWREVYRIEGHHLLLTDVYLKGFGAGVPSDLEGVTVNEGGSVHTSKIDREIDELNWVHSHATAHVLRVFLVDQPEPVLLQHEIPHRTFTTAFIGTAADIDK